MQWSLAWLLKMWKVASIKEKLNIYFTFLLNTGQFFFFVFFLQVNINRKHQVKQKQSC